MCRHYLLRDVYDDMKLDGVQPTADIFHSFVVGVMKGARLSDAFFFREEMKSMGISPDVCLSFSGWIFLVLESLVEAD